MAEESPLLLATLERLETNSNEQGKVLATLAADVKSLVGNGQPGRVGVLEKKVESLVKWRYTLTGGALVLGVFVHAAYDYGLQLLRFHK